MFQPHRRSPTEKSYSFVQPCGMKIRRSCTIPWNHARASSSWALISLPSTLNQDRNCVTE